MNFNQVKFGQICEGHSLYYCAHVCCREIVEKWPKKKPTCLELEFYVLKLKHANPFNLKGPLNHPNLMWNTIT